MWKSESELNSNICKKCNKVIPSGAFRCPFCGGEPLSCLGLIALLCIVLVIGWCLLECGRIAIEKQIEKEGYKGFQFTVEEMIDRYNKSFKIFKNTTKLTKKKEISRHNYSLVEIKANKPLNIIVIINKKSRTVRSFTIVARGYKEEQLEKGLQVVVASSKLALEYPNKNEITKSEIIEDYNKIKKAFDRDEKISLNRKGVLYHWRSRMGSGHTLFELKVEPEKTGSNNIQEDSG
jgi:hypothetical protein